MRHWVGLDAYCSDPKFLALNERRSGPAKRVEHDAVAIQVELVYVLANEMGGKGEDKAIPAVNRAVFRPQPVHAAVRPGQS